MSKPESDKIQFTPEQRHYVGLLLAKQRQRMQKKLSVPDGDTLKFKLKILGKQLASAHQQLHEIRKQFANVANLIE